MTISDYERDLAAATARFAARDFGETRTLVKSLVERQPNDTRAVSLYARLAEAAGDWANADLLWRYLLQLTPASLEGLTGRGRALIGGGQLEEAIELLNGVLADRPEDPTVRETLANAFFTLAIRIKGLGKIQEATDLMQIVSELDPQRLDAQKHQVMMAALSGRLDLAADIARTSRRFHPVWEASLEEGRLGMIDTINMFVLSLPWDSLHRTLPASINTLITSGWLASLAAAEPIDVEGAPLPWLTYPAIDFLEPRVPSDARVFEWGGGNSTAWWSPRVASIHTIESDPAWAARIRDRQLPNVVVEQYADPEAYAGAILRFPPNSFDIVVVDGDNRNACAAAIGDRVKPDGIIVVDNSDMAHHRDGVAHLLAQGWHRLDFFGLIPGFPYRNCTTVFIRDLAILNRAPLPSDHQSSLGPTCAQAVAIHEARKQNGP